MDWARAKSLFIIIFVFLNVFLLFYILDYRAGEDISEKAVSNTIQVLEEREIQLECEIPQAVSEMQKLSCESTGFDQAKVVDQLLGDGAVIASDSDEDPVFTAGSRKVTFLDESYFVFKDSNPGDTVDISDGGKAEKYIKKFLGDIGIDIVSYKMDEYTAGPDNTFAFSLTYHYKGYPVFDRIVKGDLTRHGITRLECRIIDIKGLSGDKLEVVPAYKILLSKFTKGDHAISIHSIRLGFKGTTGLNAGMKETQEGPVWRIGIKDAEPRYFSAYNGEEIFTSGE